MKAINTNKIIFVSSPVLAVEDCFLSFLVVEVITWLSLDEVFPFEVLSSLVDESTF